MRIVRIIIISNSSSIVVTIISMKMNTINSIVNEDLIWSDNQKWWILTKERKDTMIDRWMNGWINRLMAERQMNIQTDRQIED